MYVKISLYTKIKFKKIKKEKGRKYKKGEKIIYHVIYSKKQFIAPTIWKLFLITFSLLT